MITPSFSLTATERVLPKLALDFTTASLDPRVTFTRTTGASNPATYVNSSGYVTAATDNQPRFDYNPITLACKGLLIEETRANLLLQSEDFATTWAVINVTPTTNVETSPSNLQNADKIAVANGQSLGSNYIYQGVAKSASAITYTASVFAKAAEFNSVVILINDNANLANRSSVTVSLVNGSITTAAAALGTFTSASATVASYRDGWYRIALTFTSGTEVNLRYRIYTGDSTATTGNGTSGIYVWGAQLEAGAFPTSYIPTVASTVTRNADVATMTGTNFSDWYNASEGSFTATGILGGGSTNRDLIAVNDGTANNVISIRWASGSQAQFSVTTLGVNQVNIAPAGYSTLNTVYKRNCGYKLNNFAQGINGILTGTDIVGTIPTVDRLTIGTASNGVVNLVGWVQNIYYWPQKLTNAEITAFSK